MKKPKYLLLFPAIFFLNIATYTQSLYSARESNYIIRDFKFESGESLPELKINYYTLGRAIRDKTGKTTNAVLIMHGTSGNGENFLSQQFAGVLFNPGQVLDSTKYFIILPDAIGHGKSSKPSNGLHMRFPKYTYNDMVALNYRVLTEHLGVNHLLIVMGTSMGGMQTWVWAYTHPDFMDALMPLASMPVEIAGKNRMWRKMAIDLIKMDPEWKQGEYTSQPKVGLTGALGSLLSIQGNAMQWQKRAPTRAMADSLLEAVVSRVSKLLDANDMIYQLEASRHYNPVPHLSKIKAPLFAVNFADDLLYPAELRLMEKEIVKVPKGKYILVPTTDKTNGHATCMMPEIWGSHLAELVSLTNKN